MFGRSTLSQRVERLESEVAVIRRLYQKTLDYRDSDPETALMNARKAAEAICSRVFEHKVGKQPKTMTLQPLIERLAQLDALPEHILVALRTIQGYGNLGSHHQPGESEKITPEFAQPCLQALGTVVQWYFQMFGHEATHDHVSDGPTARPRRARGIGNATLISAVAVLLAATGFIIAVFLRSPSITASLPRTEHPSPSPASRSQASSVTHPTIAVLPFECLSPDEPHSVSLEGSIRSFVRSALEDTNRFHAIERTRLESVLGELQLNRSTQFDPSQVAQIGKLLGARRLVLGEYFQLGDSLRINIRFVDTETGTVLWSAGHDGDAMEVASVAKAAATAVLERIPDAD